MSRHRRAAARLVVGDLAEVEDVQPGQRLFHLGEVFHPLLERLGVLLLCLAGNGGFLVLQAQKPGQPVEHLQIPDILVADVKARLAADLQPAPDIGLEGLPLGQMIAETFLVEADAGRARLGHVAQTPLAGLAGDLERDEGIERIAAENDLRAAFVGQAMGKHPGVVIAEEAEPRQAVGFFPHAGNQRQRVGLAPGKGEAQQLFPFGAADETGIEGLAIASDAGIFVEICLKEIRAGPHAGEDHEIVEPVLHRSTVSDRGAGGQARVRPRRGRPGNRQPDAAACPGCGDSAETGRNRRGQPSWAPRSGAADGGGRFRR